MKRSVLRDGSRIVRNHNGDPVFVDETIVSEEIKWDWRAAQAILRSRWRERWGEQVQVQAHVELSMPPQTADAEAIAALQAAYVEAGILPALPAGESANAAQ